jgi:dipeptidase E
VSVVAAIHNALDVESDWEAWLGETLGSLARDGTRVETIDLRAFVGTPDGLRDKLAAHDVIWLCGGNGFYLRWILRESGTDTIIRDLVSRGTVYSGWSAGAVLAGPTLHYFEDLEDLTVVPEILYDCLNLTDEVILPHMDLPEFGDGMRRAQPQLEAGGYTTQPLIEGQALLINGTERRFIDLSRA